MRPRSPRTVRALLAAVTALGLAILAGCGQSANTPQAGEDVEGSLVGISMPTRSSERWIDDGDNMVAQFTERGFETDLQYGDDVVGNQVSQIENMITRGARVLVVAAIDGSALSDVLGRAADQGIRVIAYDRLIRETPDVDYYATFDNFGVGVLQGTYLAEQLELDAATAADPRSIELFAGSPDDNNSQFFFDGAMSVLQPYLDSGVLVVGSGQTSFQQAATLRWDGGLAQSRMDNLLSSAYTGDRVDGVLSPYDGISIGILSSLRGVGYGTDAQPFPVVTGQDAEVASVGSIARGEQTMTVFKDTRELARVAVDMAEAVLNGTEPEVNDTEQYDNGVKVVPAFLLEPVSIDASNLQTLVDSGYYTAEEITG